MNKKTVSIHQPVYLPWLGFFKKISTSDQFVFLDDVQFEKNGWHNRNKIRTSDGWIWLTVPTKTKFGMNLNEIKIDNSINWKKKHKKAIEINYSKTPYFKNYWNELESIFNKKHELLIELNLELIKFIMKNLQIKTPTIFSSELNIDGKSSERILNICNKLKSKIYLSGKLGKDYLDLDDVSSNGIEVKFQDYKHHTNEQSVNTVMPIMTTKDLLSNKGDQSSEILRESNNF